MNEYWFRRRRGLLSSDLGWGWIPISTEGWLITLGMIGTLYWVLTKTDYNKWISLVVIIVIFAFIADLKTEDKVFFK